MISAMEDEIRDEILDVISEEFKNRKWSNEKAAEMLGTNTSRISCINTKRKQYKFNIQTLISWLLTLGLDIDICIKQSKKKTGSIRISPSIK